MLRFRDMDEFNAWQASRQSQREERPTNSKERTGRTPGRMTKTERAFADRLEAQRKAGEIVSWRFEAQKFRLTDLADRTWYTPDFKVLFPDGRQEFIEVKGGHIWEDGLVKFKIARSQFPEYAWSLWQRRKTQWVRLK